MFREQCIGLTNEWYTPPHVFAALGQQFDLDVASPGERTVPWIPARQCYTWNALSRPWQGFVWMNPPFGGRNGLVPWLRKFVEHGNGIALVPDRTSAPWWQMFMPCMEFTLFVAPKIRFIAANGARGSTPAQGSCLFSIGRQGEQGLRTAMRNGLGKLMESA